jgi:uncharacterized protein YoxC
MIDLKIAGIIGIAFLAVTGTLWAINRAQSNTIEEQAQTIATIESQVQIKEMENQRLNLAIKEQNLMVIALANKGKELENKVTNQELLIESLQQQGEVELVEIDGQEVPKTPEGALQWMLEKALVELR